MILRCAARGGLQIRGVSTYYDAVVVGGGLVGNAMACALGGSKLGNKRILLLEGGNPKPLPEKPSEIYSNRVSAVSPASVELFKNIGVWDRISHYRSKKVSQLHVLDSCSTSELQFDPLSAKDDIAYIIENDVIVGSLFEHLEDCENVDVTTGVAVKGCSLPGSLNNFDLATVELQNGETIETSLVIGADGFKSKVRETMGVDYTSWNYEQSGLVATVTLETDSNDIAWQRFTEQGPIALLPLTDKMSSLVWTVESSEVKRLLALKPDQFVDELNHLLQSDENQNHFVNQTLFMFSRLCPTSNLASRAVPPHIISLQSDTRAGFPFGFGHSHSYVSTRAAIIGDAAHRVHPLAGQGVNLGWSDVTILSNILQKAHSEGGDWGSLTYLSDFDSQAQRHNVPVMVAIDWLNRLYRTKAAPFVFARSLGLSAFNKLTPIKNLLVQQLSAPKY